MRKINDDNIIHKWRCPECGEEAYIPPTFYEEAGTPLCECTDMNYIETQVDDMIIVSFYCDANKSERSRAFRGVFSSIEQYINSIDESEFTTPCDKNNLNAINSSTVYLYAEIIELDIVGKTINIIK